MSRHHSLTSCCFRVFKTPGLRTPALNERVYTISANGSPLADTGDAVLTLPLGGGEVSPDPHRHLCGLHRHLLEPQQLRFIHSCLFSCAIAVYQGTD